MKKEVNIAIVGLGGQGVITLTKLLAMAYKSIDKDVCYNEVHGLSQRGGSVQSLLTINSKNCPVFALQDTDFLIGLEKLETLRFLYASKAHPTVVLGNKYEMRNTVYFDMEYFPQEDEIDQEIFSLAKELYRFNSVEYEKQVAFRIKPTNIAIFGILSRFPQLELEADVLKQTVKQFFKKDPLSKSFNMQAFKEGKSWFQEIKVQTS